MTHGNGDSAQPPCRHAELASEGLRRAFDSLFARMAAVTRILAAAAHVVDIHVPVPTGLRRVFGEKPDDLTANMNIVANSLNYRVGRGRHGNCGS